MRAFSHAQLVGFSRRRFDELPLGLSEMSSAIAIAAARRRGIFDTGF
jgi:hypothetical protein